MSSNQSQINSSTIWTTPSLDQLLDTLGFDAWKTILASFILPLISCLGVIFCSLSAWIFFQKKFKDPVFFYYRLLCLVYIIHLVHNIPRGLLYSPRYFPNINTYLSSLFLIYYSNVSAFLFHFEETLQIAIVLNRMKIYSPFVNKHYTAKPWVVSLSFFLTCLLINCSYAFALKVDSFGTYHFNDSSASNASYAQLYYTTSSDFSSTLFGQILLACTVPFLNLFLTIFIGTILNIVFVYQYRSHVRERRRKDEAYVLGTNKQQNQATTSLDDIEVVVVSRPRELTQKEINENRAEKNMFFMALTLSSISIVSRSILIVRYVVFFNFYSFSTILIFFLINLTMYTLVPTVAIFIFYTFNKMFREEFRKKVFNKEKTASNQVVIRR